MTGTRFRLPEPDERARRDLIENLRPQLPVLGTDSDVFLSTHDVALLFRVSAATIRRWADAGKLEAHRSLGGQRMFPLSSVRTALVQLLGTPQLNH